MSFWITSTLNKQSLSTFMTWVNLLGPVLEAILMTETNVLQFLHVLSLCTLYGNHFNYFMLLQNCLLLVCYILMSHLQLLCMYLYIEVALRRVPMRSEVQMSLGEGPILSGSNVPTRRVPSVLRHAHSLVLALQAKKSLQFVLLGENLVISPTCEVGGCRFDSWKDQLLKGVEWSWDISL